MHNRFPTAERSEKHHELPRAQFTKPILVDEEEHFPINEDWAQEFVYQELGGEG